MREPLGGCTYAVQKKSLPLASMCIIVRTESQVSAIRMNQRKVRLQCF